MQEKKAAKKTGAAPRADNSANGIGTDDEGPNHDEPAAIAAANDTAAAAAAASGAAEALD
jgi:hypothetical protein